MDKLVLVCRVNFLIYKVHFFNPIGKEIGYCLAPIPHPHCFPNGSLTQDTETNTTKLTMIGHFDNSIQGEWKCLHGTNIDKATINVTVEVLIKEDQLHENGKVCWQAYLAWTMLGLVALLMVIGIVWIVVYYRSCDGIEQICKSTRDLMRISVIKQLVVVGVIVLLIIPFVHGLAQGSNCTNGIEALYFFFGMISAIMGLVLAFEDKDKQPISNTSSTPDEEEIVEIIPLENEEDRRDFPYHELNQEEI